MYGISLLALGKPYYGQLAYNLALSIKKIDNEIPICLIWAEDALNGLNDTLVFDKLIQCPSNYYLHGNTNKYLKAKLYLNNLTPYNETLFIDADSIWVSSITPTQFIKNISGVQFTAQNFGAFNVERLGPDFYFAKLKDIVTEYKIQHGKIFKINSALMYWEKGELSDSVFEKAKTIYNSPKCTYKGYYGEMSDELPFMISSSILHIYPHIENWTPIYFNYLSNKLKQQNLQDIQENFVAITMTRGHTPNWLVKIYNDHLYSIGPHYEFLNTDKHSLNYLNYINF